jgi:hypothetical protein
MKKLLFFSALFVLLLADASFAHNCTGDSGAIWATHADGSKHDYFAPGEDVYLDGHKFESNTEYSYKVLDMDNNKTVVASGTVETDGNGDIIRKKIWTIPAGDYYGHKYRVDLIYCSNRSGHRHKKSDSFYTGGISIPEFPSPAAPALLALGGYLLLKAKRGRRSAGGSQN